MWNIHACTNTLTGYNPKIKTQSNHEKTSDKHKLSTLYKEII